MPSETGGRHWFHLIPSPSDQARLQYAARLTEKAWREGDRVCLFCGSDDQAQQADDVLWSFRPDSFLPHALEADAGPGERVVISCHQPAASEWDTVIVLGDQLPADADRFKRLALIANDDPQTLSSARSHFRQLREMGIEPQVHDRRRGTG
ncbi:DNA polymerase III subunit chi [Tamilnaduibacter salinus]|uniref:DNA polymerase III subunit chi n=1 Tax=Tamilnaduibacter salinus TaxID=1484056 RepID=A0A2A2HZ50_9GAMM|nr:DNA polymerase III subunit chi [Tamilnaduibacter salinus]PAV24532.1 DNA polymerase III subunit chi [Tamilnaduibacter salinus]